MTDPIDYKALLEKYMSIVINRQDYDFLGNAYEIAKDSNLSEEEHEELVKLASEAGYV